MSKIGRGKHTTRHSEIFEVDDDTFVLDTPGFTSMDLPDINKENKLRLIFRSLYDFSENADLTAVFT